eukprot:m.177657 g.177657  ORF g.177657 m.177657 type:complete len:484 (-) comp24497_c0_seq2:2236-3687(-)
MHQPTPLHSQRKVPWLRTALTHYKGPLVLLLQEFHRNLPRDSRLKPRVRRQITMILFRKWPGCLCVVRTNGGRRRCRRRRGRCRRGRCRRCLGHNRSTLHPPRLCCRCSRRGWVGLHPTWRRPTGDRYWAALCGQWVVLRPLPVRNPFLSWSSGNCGTSRLCMPGASPWWWGALLCGRCNGGRRLCARLALHGLHTQPTVGVRQPKCLHHNTLHTLGVLSTAHVEDVAILGVYPRILRHHSKQRELRVGSRHGDAVERVCHGYLIRRCINHLDAFQANDQRRTPLAVDVVLHRVYTPFHLRLVNLGLLSDLERSDVVAVDRDIRPFGVIVRILHLLKYPIPRSDCRDLLGDPIRVVGLLRAQSLPRLRKLRLPCVFFGTSDSFLDFSCFFVLCQLFLRLQSSRRIVGARRTWCGPWFLLLGPLLRLLLCCFGCLLHLHFLRVPFSPEIVSLLLLKSLLLCLELFLRLLLCFKQIHLDRTWMTY